MAKEWKQEFFLFFFLAGAPWWLLLNLKLEIRVIFKQGVKWMSRQHIIHLLCSGTRDVQKTLFSSNRCQSLIIFRLCGHLTTRKQFFRPCKSVFAFLLNGERMETRILPVFLPCGRYITLPGGYCLN